MLSLHYLDENGKDSIKDQRTQEDLWKFEIGLIYVVSNRLTKAK